MLCFGDCSCLHANSSPLSLSFEFFIRFFYCTTFKTLDTYLLYLHAFNCVNFAYFFFLYLLMVFVLVRWWSKFSAFRWKMIKIPIYMHLACAKHRLHHRLPHHRYLVHHHCLRVRQVFRMLQPHQHQNFNCSI